MAAQDPKASCYPAATRRACAATDLWTGAPLRLAAGAEGVALLPAGASAALLRLQGGRCVLVSPRSLRALDRPSGATREAFPGARSGDGLEPWLAALVDALASPEGWRAAWVGANMAQDAAWERIKARHRRWQEYDQRVERRKARPWLPPPPKPPFPRPKPEELTWRPAARRVVPLEEVERPGNDERPGGRP